MITFGQKLRYLRNKKHLTQKQLGTAVGFPDSSADVRIAQYEAGQRIPREELMKQFSELLGVPVSFLKVPVLSEPSEYLAADYWIQELSITIPKTSEET